MENEQRKYWFFGSKLNTALLLVLIVLMVIALRWMYKNKEMYLPTGNQESLVTQVKGETYTYTNHGFSIELPKGFIPKETESEGGPSIVIPVSGNSFMLYVTNSSFWEKSNIPSFNYLGEEKIGENNFKIYEYNNEKFYWLKKGAIGYEFHGDKKQLETFKFIGWSK